MEEKITKIPTHVSIIMDGNGRWARERGKERVFGHLNGVESVRAVTEESVRLGIKYLSLYTFSEENWSRPESEVGYLMNLMIKSIAGELDNFMRNGVRFLALGNRKHLPELVLSAIDGAMEATKDNKNLTLILFLSYSGRWDILQAARRMAEDFASHPGDLAGVDAEAFGRYLVTADIPDPDLIIRTSGEERISNYLLWQGAYSELVFTPVLWPDFREEDYRKALLEYSLRDRRYGKVK